MHNNREVTNPILPGDYPDPSIIRVGEDYYMVCSTFQFFPGVPVLHSRDLIHWDTIGHVITRESQLSLNGLPDSYGVYAPDISYYNDKFWVVVPYFHGQPRCTNLLFVSDRPEGPYGEAILLNHHFIDPSIFNDDDGKRYLLYGGGWIHELREDGSGLVGSPRQVWPGTGGSFPEAPHIVKRNEWYYLMLAEGGTFFDHMETLARSRSVWGPYEACPHNPVLKQSDANHRIQKTGHGKLVQDPRGDWWMFHLGGRPLTPGGHCPLGRETFLQPVQWTEDDWFVVGDDGKPLESMTISATARGQSPVLEPITETFTGPELPKEWEWVRHPVADGYALVQEGLELRCKPFIPHSVGSTLLLTKRWRHFGFEDTVKLRFLPETRGEEAGISLYRDSDAFVFFSIRNGIGQTTGQMFDVSRLHENQEHEGLYLQIDQYVKAIRQNFCQIKLNIAWGHPIWLRQIWDVQAGSFRFAYSTDGLIFNVVDVALHAEFLYPENSTRFMCFTAPRSGVYARGVYADAKHGKAIFTGFRTIGKE
ncbi:MAG: family 43 glycosylhydrolase [Gorillibacterium sp.]|nr:family 43 glycosylhydrolase [Gorillibacterium sp.]